MGSELEEAVRRLIATTDWAAELSKPCPPLPDEKWAAEELVESFLITPERFIRDHTCQGLLFHGTPSIENVAGILSNGFRPTSRIGVGTVVFVTRMWETAEVFACRPKSHGPAVIDLRMNERILALPPDRGGLRVLVWDSEREKQFRAEPSARFIAEVADDRQVPVWNEVSKIFKAEIVIAEGYGTVVTDPRVLALPKSLGAVFRSLDDRARENPQQRNVRRMAESFSNELMAGILDIEKRWDNPAWRREASRFAWGVLREIAAMNAKGDESPLD